MIVRLKDAARDAEIEAVLSTMRGTDTDARRVLLPFGQFIVGMDRQDRAVAEVRQMPGVESVVVEAKGPVLVAREANAGGTAVPLGRTLVGGKDLAIIAGPCSVEDKSQLMTAARFVAAYGATALRGGAYKPRTSPYAFQGLRQGGLAILDDVRRATGLPVVTEAMEPEDVDAMCDAVDCIQVGARSMQNFPLLRAVGRAGKPVLLKRGPASSLGELLLAAEYILVEGNSHVILCERGIRTFETATRNTLDLNAVPVLKSKTHLPVIVDPSHGTGRRDAVIPMARAAVAAGADGLIVEVHPDPDSALSDGDQSLTLDQFRQLMEEIRPVAEAVGRRISVPGSASSQPAPRSPARTALGWGTT